MKLICVVILMSKFIPIPVEEVEEVVEEEITENEVLPPRKTKEIFKMDEDESDDDEPTREIPPPPIPLKKERSKKQMEHLERMRAKSLATRQAKALKKKQEEEKKRKENAEKIVKETKQIIENKDLLEKVQPKKYDKSKPNGVPRKVMDVSLAKKYGWKYKLNLETSIKITYQSFLRELNK